MADARGRQVGGRDRRASEGPRHQVQVPADSSGEPTGSREGLHPVRPSQGASAKGLLAVVFIYLHTYLLSTTTTTTFGFGITCPCHLREGQATKAKASKFQGKGYYGSPTGSHRQSIDPCQFH